MRLRYLRCQRQHLASLQNEENVLWMTRWILLTPKSWPHGISKIWRWLGNCCENHRYRAISATNMKWDASIRWFMMSTDVSYEIPTDDFHHLNLTLNPRCVFGFKSCCRCTFLWWTIFPFNCSRSKKRKGNREEAPRNNDIRLMIYK